MRLGDFARDIPNTEYEVHHETGRIFCPRQHDHAATALGLGAGSRRSPAVWGTEIGTGGNRGNREISQKLNLILRFLCFLLLSCLTLR